MFVSNQTIKQTHSVTVCVLLLLLLCAGCRNKEMGKMLKELFQTPYFRVVVMPDEETVELCGALKVSRRHINFSWSYFAFLSCYTVYAAHLAMY